MKLYTVKNRDQEKILREKLSPFDFSSYTKKDVDALVKGMREKMKIEKGIGLAANQVGLNAQVFVAQNEGKFYAFFNPKIEKTFGEKTEMEEGCLSVPGTYGKTKRYEKISILAQDKGGKKIRLKAWGLLAQIFQHEIDHLSGKLFIDHATNIYDSRPNKN
jgi:peptide deformylase